MNASAGLDLTQSFLVLAEELNFRRASERLAVDQSALTRRIQKLEHLVGFSLFERTTREVSLTPAGRSFYEANAELLHGFGASVRAARRVAEGKTGQLRIGYMAFAASELMPQAVARFRAGSPDIELSIRYMRTQGQKLALADGTLDAGYMIGPFEHSEFQTLAVADDPLCVVMQAEHELADYEHIEPAQLAGQPMVLGDMVEWEAYRWRIDEMFQTTGVRLSPVLEASNTLALIGLVAAGLGVTIYPARLGGYLNSRLAVRPITDPSFRIQTVLAWKRTSRSASVRGFVNAARQIARSNKKNLNT